MRKVLTIWLMLVMLVLPASALASIGVGIGTGKIELRQSLRAGGIYSLPTVVVFNTGTQTANYTMAVTQNQTQPQFKPNPAWFSFSPSTFKLDPGKSQTVTPTIHLPIRMQPGNYFAYLEAHPAETAKQGITSVGVAAATKLSFNVTPSNVLIAIAYRLLNLYRQSEPWSQVGTLVLAFVVVLIPLNQYINLRAALKAAWTAGRSSK
jgi:hypothetical protein